LSYQTALFLGKMSMNNGEQHFINILKRVAYTFNNHKAVAKNKTELKEVK
jgi:hypothetical protein